MYKRQLLRLVANHVNQAVEGNVHEVLVIDLAEVDILFPTFAASTTSTFIWYWLWLIDESNHKSHIQYYTGSSTPHSGST